MGARPLTVSSVQVYRGHGDLVRCLSISPGGQWLVSGGPEMGAVPAWGWGWRGRAGAESLLCPGSDDGSVRLWEVATARCMKTVPVGGVVKSVAWNPHPTMCLVAVAV